MEGLVQDLPVADRAVFQRQLGELQRLPFGELGLQEFLDAYLQQVARILAASAGAIWFRASERTRTASGSNPCEPDYSIRASVGFERLNLVGDLLSEHQRLLRYAGDRAAASLVKPYSAPSPQARASNPTDSFVLLGPIKNRHETLGIVELFLGPFPPRGRTVAQRKRYVAWLDGLLPLLNQGIERRFLATRAPLAPAIQALESVGEEIQHHQQAIRHSIEQKLAAFCGWNFGTLAENQVFAARVHELLESNGLRVECPECGAPAILRCQGAGNSKTGVFLFDHYLETGRTFHGGPTTFPGVKVVAKPPRRKPAH